VINGRSFAQVFYLLVYSSALINAASSVVFRKKLAAAGTGPAILLFFSIAVCSTLLSVQVFVNAAGLLDRIDEDSAYRITILLNMLITSSLAAIMYSSVVSSFSLRTAEHGNLISRTAAAVSAAGLLPLLLLQILILLTQSAGASEILGILMLAGAAMFFSGSVFAAVRLFVPFRNPGEPSPPAAVMVLFAAIVLIPLLIIIAGGSSGGILSPVGFLFLNLTCIAAVFSLLKSEGAGKDLANPQAEEEYDPRRTCAEMGLSGRETDVALLLSGGRSYKEIAAELFISVSTTQTHVGRIYSKLGVNSKTELANLVYYRKNTLHDTK